MKLLTICPTRDRPEQLKRMLESFCATKRGDTEIIVFDNNTRPIVEVINNAIAANPGFDYYQEVNDDHIYITEGWDMELINTIEQQGKGIGMAWGRDGFSNKEISNLPTAVVMSVSMIKAAGYFFPPIFKHTYCDNALLDIGRATGTMFYNSDVIIEHRHCIFGKAQIDDNYKRVMSKEWLAEGKYAYEEWCANSKVQDIERIKDAVKSWRADKML